MLWCGCGQAYATVDGVGGSVQFSTHFASDSDARNTPEYSCVHLFDRYRAEHCVAVPSYTL